MNVFSLGLLARLALRNYIPYVLSFVASTAGYTVHVRSRRSLCCVCLVRGACVSVLWGVVLHASRFYAQERRNFLLSVVPWVSDMKTADFSPLLSFIE